MPYRRIRLGLKHYSVLLIIIFINLITPFSGASSAAWVQPKGKGQFIKSLSYYTTTSYFNSKGERVLQDRYSKIDYNPYFEYGFSDTITLGLSSTVQYITQNGGLSTSIPELDISNFELHWKLINFGIGDTSLFFRKLLWSNKKSVFSIQPSLFLPGAAYNSTSAIGNNQVDIEIRGLFGYSFVVAEKDSFFNVEIGIKRLIKRLGGVVTFEQSSSEYNFLIKGYTGGPELELNFDIMLGTYIRKNTLLLFQSFTRLKRNPTNTATYTSNDGTSLLFTSRMDSNIVKLQLSTVEKINENLSLQTALFRNVLGQNTGGGGGVLLSLWINF